MVRRLALLLTLIAVSVAAALGTLWLNRASGSVDVLDDLFVMAAALGMTVVGALIVHRRPGNRIGWLLLIAGVSTGLVWWGDRYALHAHAPPGPPGPAAVWVAWLTAWSWGIPALLIFVFIPLVFPDGRLPSRRWRPVLWGAVGLGLYLVAYAVAPGPLRAVEGMSENPLGVPALAPVVAWLFAVEAVPLVAVMAGVVAAVVARWRRSASVERQQLKWFLAATVPLAVGGFVSVLRSRADTDPLLGAVMLAMAGSIGVAVLRYRLYDIDRIISRTLTYGLVVGALTAIYVTGVLALGALMPLGRGEDRSALAVAVLTLALVVVFRPLRRRVQAVVDRRFNRKGYEARQVLEAFTQGLRAEVALDEMIASLADATADALEPARVSVWLTPKPLPASGSRA